MREPETRALALEDAQLTVERVDGRPIIRGVAVPYGALSRPLKDAKGVVFRERFRPGAFARALPTADIRGLVNHNRDLILGRNTAPTPTLRVIDGPDALRYEIDPPPTAIGEHYVSAVERGDMTGASFRFYGLADRWTIEAGMNVREIIEADIDDISIVVYPAFDDSSAAIRSVEDHIADQRRSQPRRDPWLDRAWVRLRLAKAGS